MRQEILLNRFWQLYEAPLSLDAGQIDEVIAPGKPFFEVSLPCDVHVPLIDAGLIPEPLEGLQTDDCVWVENRSWWFVNRFMVPEAFWEADRVILTLDRMDTCADILLNGSLIGSHRNAFRPFEMNVLPFLRPGENCLAIRLTAGHETVSEEECGILIPFVCTEGDRSPRPEHPRGDWRRAGLRKPQYVYGWDWGPRLVTCGMGGPVKLVAEGLLEISHVAVRTLSLEWEACEEETVSQATAAILQVDLEVDTFPHISTCEGEIQLAIRFQNEIACTLTRRVCLRSGYQTLSLAVRVENPRLWWPNGMGQPDLYTADLSLSAWLPGTAKGSRHQAATVTHPTIRFGIRTIELDDSLIVTAPPSEDEQARKEGPEPQAATSDRHFQLLVNGEPVFCKGGNWIPSDALYLRISDEKYRTLVQQAALSNYNMLRVWGGGFYETDLFFELCDAHGLLVWQDLMFACSAFPDHLAWFRQECGLEIEHQAIRLRNHPSLVMWSGNNEIHAGYDGWWEGSDVLFPYGGMQVWNHIAPRLLHRLTPDIPYWNSSPYGGFHPGDPGCGDVHHWGDCMMSPVMEKRITPGEFDRVTAKFVSEYGYVGPCRLSSIARYHGGAPVLRDGPIWKEHNNTFEKDTVLAGIRKHYRDTDTMDMDHYLLYAGLCQGLMLGYSLEALRARTRCAGAVYWMYNDTWGETGWTTLDYYLQRKISFPFVKRALSPLKLILRRDSEAEPQTAGHVTYAVTGINETPNTVGARLAYGFCRFDGRTGGLPERDVTLPARSRGVLFSFEVPFGQEVFSQAGNGDLRDGLVAVIPVAVSAGDPVLLPATDSQGEFRKWLLPKPDLSLEIVERTPDSLSFLVGTDVYAHAVHFCLDERVELSDEYFDLLPGERRHVRVEAGHEWLPETLPAPVCANSLQ